MATTSRFSQIPAAGRLAAGLALAATAGWAANMGNTLNITTGTTITRDWSTIVAQDYVYGAKQSYSVSGSSTTTHIYLPYGDADGVYYGANGISFQNAGQEQLALASNNNGTDSCYVSFKLHFDRPISAFAMNAGWSNWNLIADGTDVIAGAAQYSTDGITWIDMWSGTSDANPGMKEPLLSNYQVADLAASELYLRFITYDQTNPADTSGGQRYMQLRMAGAGAWGEGGFLGNVMQLEVTTVPEPAALSLLAIGGMFLIRRRR